MNKETIDIANDNIKGISLKIIIAVRLITGLCASIAAISIYHQWAIDQPILKERIKIAICDRNLLIHQEAMRLAKLNLSEAERKKEITKYIVKYRKIIDAHSEIIFDPQPQGSKVIDLTPQIKKEIESVNWKS